MAVSLKIFTKEIVLIFKIDLPGINIVENSCVNIVVSLVEHRKEENKIKQSLLK